MDDELRFVARDGFVVREILGEYMLVPIPERHKERERKEWMMN